MPSCVQKNIDLLEKVGRNPRSTKGRARRNIKVLGTSIEERPKSIENRQEFDHWEIDTVVGKIDADEPVLLTLAKRKTRFEKIFKIAGQRADAADKTLQTFIQSLKGLDSQIFKTITSANGSEFANLSHLAEKNRCILLSSFCFF